MRAIPALAILLACAPPASAQQVTVTRADCARLVQHRPAPDVAYQPGVDVRGRPVAPADLHARPPIKPPETITIDIAVDLRRFGVPATSRLYEPNARIGTVQVASDGRVYFDGVALDDPETAAIAELCRQRGGARR